MSRFWFLLLLGSCPSVLLAQQYQAGFTAAPGTNMVLATGTVEKVFELDEDGFLFRAYQVKHKSSEIIVNDLASMTNLKIGDKITFRIMKTDLTSKNPNLKKMLTFNVVQVLPNR